MVNQSIIAVWDLVSNLWAVLYFYYCSSNQNVQSWYFRCSCLSPKSAKFLLWKKVQKIQIHCEGLAKKGFKAARDFGWEADTSEKWRLLSPSWGILSRGIWIKSFLSLFKLLPIQSANITLGGYDFPGHFQVFESTTFSFTCYDENEDSGCEVEAACLETSPGKADWFIPHTGICEEDEDCEKGLKCQTRFEFRGRIDFSGKSCQ